MSLGLLLVGTVLSPARAALTVENVREGETLRYPVALLRGTSEGPVRVVNTDNPRSEGSDLDPAQGGQYKALVELRPGVNHLRLTAGADDRRLTLTYQPMTTPYRVNLVYVTAEDGDTRYLTQKSNDRQDYARKIGTAAELMQTFTAERLHDLGLERKTFSLERDRAGRPVVHTVRYPAPAETLRGKRAMSCTASSMTGSRSSSP